MSDDINQVGALFSEFNTKIAGLDEKHNLLRDRVLMADESFIKTLDIVKKEINALKDEIRQLKNSLEKMKETSDQVIEDIGGLARKEELHIMERYMKLWEPLKFVKTDEVRKIVKEEVKKSGEEKEE